MTPLALISSFVANTNLQHYSGEGAARHPVSSARSRRGTPTESPRLRARGVLLPFAGITAIDLLLTTLRLA